MKPAPARSDVPVRRLQKRKQKAKKKSQKSTDQTNNVSVPNDTIPNDTISNDTIPNDSVPNDSVPNDDALESLKSKDEALVIDGKIIDVNNEVTVELDTPESLDDVECLEELNIETETKPAVLSGKERLTKKMCEKKNSRVKKEYRNKVRSDPSKPKSAFCTYCKVTKPLVEFSKSQLKKSGQTGLVCSFCTQKMQVTNDKITKLKQAFAKHGMKLGLDDLINMQQYQDSHEQKCGDGCNHDHSHPHNSTSDHAHAHAHNDGEEKLEHYDDHEHTKDCKYDHNTTIKDETDYNDPLAVEKANRE